VASKREKERKVEKQVEVGRGEGLGIGGERLREIGREERDILRGGRERNLRSWKKWKRGEESDWVGRRNSPRKKYFQNFIFSYNTMNEKMLDWKLK
jgi:hypothetical protein